MRGKKIVNLSIIKNNLDYVKAKTKSKVICVVKADAYGHGGYEVAKYLDNEDGYAVATVEEALEVKDATNGLRNVLLLGKTFGCDYGICVKNRINITVDSEEELLKLDEVSRRLNTCAIVHIAVNTGMNRIGFNYDKPLYKLISCAKRLKNVKIAGVYSHLYSSDKNIAYLQRGRFIEALRGVDDQRKLIYHLGATSAVGDRKLYFDAIRLGIGLYGYGTENVTPAMEVTGKVVSVNRIKSGETVGYGGAFRATENTTVATVSLGYADGILRKYTGNEVILRGKKRKIVGNVCMDACFVLADESVKAGDEVVFIGKRKNAVIDAGDFSAALETIPYETLTGFKRIKTVYLR